MGAGKTAGELDLRNISETSYRDSQNRKPFFLVVSILRSEVKFMERAEIAGIVRATTTNAVLLFADGVERWIPRKFCRVVAGDLMRGCWVVLSVPPWLFQERARLPMN